MKTRLLFNAAALLGAIAILWMGVDFIGANALALTVTLVIGFVYGLGLVELVQFRRDTARLRGALDSAGETDNLDTWLSPLPPTLRNPVAQRIRGDRVGLPAPVFSPYLVGLLVMLGLLGTFIGMVDTLHGAVIALEGSTELNAIRAGLAAPIQGLGLAFGTSVAGVAASAMLGLNATLSRRERMQVTRLLDQCAGTVFREHSLQYNRQQTYLAMQGQAEALPQVAEQLTRMAGELERSGNTLAQQLLANQERFHRETREQYTALADSVGASLRDNLAQSGRLAGESIAPAVEQALAQITEESRSTHRELLAANQSHLAEVTQALSGTAADISAALDDSSRGMTEAAREESRGLVAEIGRLLASTETLVEARAANEASWQEQQGQRIHALTSALRKELGELSGTVSDHLSSLQANAAEHLVGLGRGLEEPMVRLIETASETPRAAAEVIGELREEVSNSLERDNQLLEERGALMQQLATLASALQETSEAQQAAVADFVGSSSAMLRSASEEFREQLCGEASRLTDATTHVAGSAAEMASLGESFALAVQLYSQSNETLVDNLSRIEASMGKSTERSDEQMSYYVAQAREIIDQSMLSQREIIEELRRLGQTGDLFATEAG